MEPGQTQRKISVLEIALLFFLLLAGFALRAWRVTSVGLDHFDEGVYVFSALGIQDAGQPYRLYPGQVRSSPVLFPGLVGLTFKAMGKPSDLAPVLLNVILGTLTILAVWLVGRAWLGPPAGFVAATLLAFNEYHISLCRTALTDVGFGLFFLLALAATASAVKRRSVTLSIVAGLAVGLAWNTKYHGALALVVIALALLPFIWIERRHGRPWKRYLVLWGLTAIVALACYLPWALLIQSRPGGYAAFAKFQSTYLNFHWLGNILRHIRMQLFLEGFFSRVSPVVAFLGAAFLFGGRRWASRRILLCLVGISATTLLIGGSGTVALLALLAVPALWSRRPESFPAWVVLGWLAVWGISTPFYRPYARLLLPFMLAASLAAAYWISVMIDQRGAVPSRSKPGPSILRTAAALGIAAVIIVLSVLRHGASDPWRPSRSVARAAVEMEKSIPPGSRTIVLSEPELAFYLHLAGRPAFERVEDMAVLEELREPVYLITGEYARARRIREGLDRLGDRLVPLGTFPVDPKDMRLLDDLEPREARRFRARPDTTFDLTLFRLQPKS